MIRDAANLGVHATGAAPPLLCVWICLAWLLIWPQRGFAEQPPRLVRHEATAEVMGCTFGVAAYGRDRDALRQHVASAFDEARAIDVWLSNYRFDSELSRLNHNAAAAPVPVSDELFELLHKAARFSRASEGAFDMTVGPLVRVWGFHDGDGAVPDERVLARTREAVGYPLVELDPARKTVHFTRAGVELDPGGIGKGYAVDRMVDALRRAEVESALVNACNSSVYGLGFPPEGPRGWRMEIDNPSDGESEEVFLKDQSLSTSGSQEKFFEAEGRLYSHIIDPRTGRPVEGLLAVSVVASTALESEVWSTAIFVNGLDWASSNMGEEFAIYGCPADGRCRWVLRDF